MTWICFIQEREEQEEELKLKEAELIRGNPLLNNPTSFNVKRRYCPSPSPSICMLFAIASLLLISDMKYYRWDDDVVFKNQARGETKAPKRFINDTIRSDFHRKFLHKYMK